MRESPHLEHWADFRSSARSPALIVTAPAAVCPVEWSFDLVTSRAFNASLPSATTAGGSSNGSTCRVGEEELADGKEGLGTAVVVPVIVAVCESDLYGVP